MKGTNEPMARNSTRKTAAPDKGTPARTDDLISLDETARITGLRTRTVSQYIALRRIPSVKLGTARLFSRGAIEAWVERRESRRRQLAELRHIDYVEAGDSQ